MAAERNSFPRRWDPCIIGFDLKIIWEMSIQTFIVISKISHVHIVGMEIYKSRNHRLISSVNNLRFCSN